MRTEFVQDPTAELDVFHGNALGNLQFESGGRQTRLLEHCSDQPHKIGVPKLLCGKIYRHPQLRMPRSAPSLGLGTGRSQDPLADGNYKSGFFGHGDEFCRQEKVTLWVLPAHESFCTGDHAIRKATRSAGSELGTPG